MQRVRRAPGLAIMMVIRECILNCGEEERQTERERERGRITALFGERK